jgi:hypothetical protein
MSKQKHDNPDATELDPRLLEAIRQEVRAQVAGLLEQVAARLKSPEAFSSPAVRLTPAAGAGLTPQKVVVISAAAAAALNRPVRVKRITFLNQNTISAWAEAGRLTIHNSHRLGRSL